MSEWTGAAEQTSEGTSGPFPAAPFLDTSEPQCAGSPSLPLYRPPADGKGRLGRKAKPLAQPAGTFISRRAMKQNFLGTDVPN